MARGPYRSLHKPSQPWPWRPRTARDRCTEPSRPVGDLNGPPSPWATASATVATVRNDLRWSTEIRREEHVVGGGQLLPRHRVDRVALVCERRRCPEVTAPCEDRAAPTQRSRQQRERARLPRCLDLPTAQHQVAVDVPQRNGCRLGEFAPLQKVVDGYRPTGKRIHRVVEGSARHALDGRGPMRSDRRARGRKASPGPVRRLIAWPERLRPGGRRVVRAGLRMSMRPTRGDTSPWRALHSTARAVSPH